VRRRRLPPGSLPDDERRGATNPSEHRGPTHRKAIIDAGWSLSLDLAVVYALGIANAWIQDAERELRPKIRKQVHAGHDHDTALEQRNVLVEGRKQQLVSKSWVAEQVLDHHQPTHEPPDLRAHDRNGWQQRVSQHVPRNNFRGWQPLQDSRTHAIAGQDFDG
jgi:hypothetical protein